MAASGMKVAPLRRRFAAGAIDGVVLVVPILGAAGAGAWLWMRYRSWRGDDDDALPVLTPRSRSGLVMAGASASLQVATRNWRSPGYRALGLRRVDLRTGGPVTIRSAIIRSAVGDLRSRTLQALTQPWNARRLERFKAVQAEAKEAQRLHAADREAMQRAIMEIYKRERVNPLIGCLPGLLGNALLQTAVFWSPLNQTLPERAAGTVVVRED